MSYLLDTNVVSEWVKPRPEPRVVQWLAKVDEDRVYLSVLSLFELRYGVDRLGDGARRRRLLAWLGDELPARFEGRMLDITILVAEAGGAIVAERERLGRPIGTVDALLAAAARVHVFTLVTRNVTDFAHTGVSLFNPWNPE